MKADRTGLHRLLIAYKAGRHVDIDAILKHELLPVPISMSETNGRLRGGNKAILFDELTKYQSPSTLIVDGQALVQSLKLDGIKNCREFATLFMDVLLDRGRNYKRIGVVLIGILIKNQTCPEPTNS